MSARQRARIQRSKDLVAVCREVSSDDEVDPPQRRQQPKKGLFPTDVDSSEEDCESGDEDCEFEEVVQKKSTFVLDSSSSSSNSVSEDEEELEEAPRQITSNSAVITNGISKRGQSKKISQVTDDAAVDEYLQEIVEKNAQHLAELEQTSKDWLSSLPVSEELLHFQIDPKQLDMDLLNRVRNPEAPRNVDRANNMRKRKVLSNKRWIYGQPDDDWIKPPSFIGGGMGMSRVATESFPTVGPAISTKAAPVIYQVFSFTWSKEYQHLAWLYSIAKATGDPNYVVMFLANHPYYAEGFIDLAVIFCQMGMLERGMKCIRRVLYLYECASMEAFKPYQGQCRLVVNTCNPSNEAAVGSNRHYDGTQGNVVYLNALSRFMQLLAVQRQVHIAAQIGRVILSLNPTDDIVCVLLSLDHHLLLAGQYEYLLQLCGMLPSSNALEESSELTVAETVQDRLDHHWERSYIIDTIEVPWDSAETSDATNKQPKDSITVNYTLDYLPNMWYSLSLAVFLGHQARDMARPLTGTTLSNHSSSTRTSEVEKGIFSKQTADQLLQQALCAWPLVAIEIMERHHRALMSVTGASYTLAVHQRMTARLASVQQGSLLDYEAHIIQCYLVRSQALWTRSEVWTWFVQNLDKALQRSDFNTATKMPNLMGERNPLSSKYLRADLDYFLDEFSQLVPDGGHIQPIDPDLLEDRVLAGGVKFKQFDKHLLRMQQLLRYQKKYGRRDQQLLRQQGHEMRGSFGWVVDVSLPLLQLFLMTLLPWMVLPPVPHQRR